MFLDRVQEFIRNKKLMPAAADVLVGASGGVDSTVLLDALSKLGFSVQAVHVNFALRGSESAQDEQFVQRLCQACSLPCHVKQVDAGDYAHRHGVSIQMAARTLRYAVFAAYAKTLGLPFVAVGHHADDQAETVLLNLLRGSGPEGLAGMPVSRTLGRATLVRPLLRESRASILQYARREGLSWREDTSNASSKYRRTVLRRRILPLLSEVAGPGAIANMARSAVLMRDYVDSTFAPTLRELFGRAAGERQLRLDVLEDLAPVWQRRLILEALRCWLPGASASVVDHILPLLSAQPGRRVELGSGIIWRGRGVLNFQLHPPYSTDEAMRLHPGHTVKIGTSVLQVTMEDTRPQCLVQEAPAVAYADGDCLQFPLVVRRWQAGDRLIPLGMTHSKKVSDVLTDHKVPVDQRTAVPVVCSGEDIVWVAGIRLSERVRVRKDTRRFVRLALI